MDAFKDNNIHHLLDAAIHKYRTIRGYFYDIAREVLTVQPMARPLHDALDLFLAEAINFAVADKTFNREELRKIKIHHWPQILPRLEIPLPKDKKRFAQLNNPDNAITSYALRPNRVADTHRQCYFFMEVTSVIAPHTPHSDCIHSPLSILISSIFTIWQPWYTGVKLSSCRRSFLCCVWTV